MAGGWYKSENRAVILIVAKKDPTPPELKVVKVITLLKAHECIVSFIFFFYFKTLL